MSKMKRKRQNIRTPNVFRQLHKRIDKWAKNNNYEWRLERTLNGWKYYLHRECIASSHKADYLTKGFKSVLRRAGIPREVIGFGVLGISWQQEASHLPNEDLEAGDTEHDKRLSDDLDNAQVGDLAWIDGHNVLITKRIEHPELTDRCHSCEGAGEAEDYQYDDYTGDRLETTHIVACFTCKSLKAYIEFMPTSSTSVYFYYVDNLTYDDEA